MVTIYEANEKGIGESHRIFALLKNSDLRPKYSSPIDWQTALWFGRGENNIAISVNEKYEGKARQLVMLYRAEQRRIERSIENERRKSERLFLR